MRLKDIQKEYSISKPTAIRYLEEFEEEILKEDSKIPKKCVIYSNNIRWVNKKAFYHFMLNRERLKDSIARKRVKVFSSKDYEEIV
ncbi:MAG: hypothetical protein E6147_05920 [Peptostreptococcus sp.]|nr:MULTISPECIES: hypothetical protein [Peptostreptococcus]MDU5350514.1 hypothetical protein [Peptostreptococcus sp.]